MDEQTQFYYTIYPHVVKAMQEEGINSAWASMVTPQMMIESNWGKDPLVKHNNFFGMKAVSLENNPVEQFKPSFGFAEGGMLKHLQPKDAWDSLTLKEKAEMMKVAIKNGIYNLKDIRAKYNEFAGGGDKENKSKPVTTGGAGYVAPAPDPSWIANKVRSRMYRTINPLTDYNIPKNAREFLAGKTMDYGDVSKNEDGSHWVDYEDRITNLDVVDDLWGKYLQIPEKERRYKAALKESKYKPTKGGHDELTYFKLPLTADDKEYLIEETDDLPIGKNKISDILSTYNIADHTVGRGFDDRGEYRSYYDRWDINPFNGKYQGWNIPFLKNLPDATLGIGKPVEIYDRIYLDDYYGVPTPTHATYLPEVVVYGSKAKTPYQELLEDMGRKKAEGGKIHIKPSHRGRLTELKARTGKTESELYNDGNPAHKRMVVFARNARKWKHGYGGNIFDGESEETQQMNTSKGHAIFLNYPNAEGALTGAVRVGGIDIGAAFGKVTGVTSAPFGHAGVILVDENGNSDYYDYGRYKKGTDRYGVSTFGAIKPGKGNWRTKKLPKQKQGENDSMYVARIQDGLPDTQFGTYQALSFPNIDIKKAKAHTIKQANDSNRRAYGVGNTCVDAAYKSIVPFLLDSNTAEKIVTPSIEEYNTEGYSPFAIFWSQFPGTVGYTSAAMRKLADKTYIMNKKK